MKTRRKLLSLVFIMVFLSTTLSVTSLTYDVTNSFSAELDDSETKILSDDLPNKKIPKSLLVYTEFADPTISSQGELKNTLDLIRANYLEDYHWDNVTDYTEVASILMDYDVFLIPEQELVSDLNVADIGAAWSGLFETFVSDGGILILMDCYSHSLSNGDGPGLQIFNETGFFTSYAPDAFSGTTNTVVNTDDALARGVNETFPATSGSLKFNATGGTAVTDDGTANKATSYHVTMGTGHFVVLGFDLYTVGEHQEQMLKNAIQLCRHIVVDQSHSPYHTVQGDLVNVSEDLVAQGYALSSMPIFSPEILAGCDVLILQVSSITYNSSEVEIIDQFVRDGGGLFIITEFGSHGEELDPVTDHFGFIRNKSSSYLEDTDDYDTFSTYIVYNTSNFDSHSVIVDVSRVEFDKGGGFDSIPDNGIPLVRTDTDGTSFWNDGSPADGVVIAAAASIGIGRVAVMSDINMISPISNSDGDADVNLYDSNNELFLFNFIQWCSAGGEEEKFVIFDESHDPDWFVNASYYGFAQFLTENGYTVRWQWGTWNPSLIESCDVMILHGYDANYTAAELSDIVDFVSAGGGIFVLGGHDYDNLTDQALNEFGFDFNNTAAINDIDDGIGSAESVFYNTSNFGTHPIMEGVSRLEIARASALLSIGGGTALVTTDTDGTAQYTDGTAADGLPVFAALEYELGRIVTVGDRFFVKYNSDFDSDEIDCLYDSDNDIFTRNAFRWLSENRAPDIELLTPSGGETVQGMLDITWNAADPNKDPMTFDLYYSPNGGSDWFLIDDALTGTSLMWDTSTVDDGTNYLIQVEAFDDKLAASVDSTAVTFTIDNNGPDISHLAIGTWPTPEAPIPISVNVTDVSGVDTVLCNYTTDGGSSWTIVNMTHDSGDTYSLDLGPFDNGTIVEYLISANDTLGQWTTLSLEMTIVAEPASTTTTTTSTTTTTDTDTGTTTPPPGDNTLIIIMAALIGVVAIIIIIVMMKKK